MSDVVEGGARLGGKEDLATREGKGRRRDAGRRERVRGGGIARVPAETRARADTSRARAALRARRRVILARGRAPTAATREYTWPESSYRGGTGKKDAGAAGRAP